MLIAALFCISGACLAYNLHTAEGGEVSASLHDLVNKRSTEEASVISAAAASNIEAGEYIPAYAVPHEPMRSYELLPALLTQPE